MGKNIQNNFLTNNLNTKLRKYSLENKTGVEDFYEKHSIGPDTPPSPYGLLRIACQTIIIENIEKPYNNKECKLPQRT
jgi:hypothetical protein